MVRYSNNFLQVCKQFQALANPDAEEDVTVLRENMGILQHHDAVSGTAKQEVTFDYAQRLDEGLKACENVTAFQLFLETLAQFHRKSNSFAGHF